MAFAQTTMRCKDCKKFKNYPEGHSLYGLGIGYCVAGKDFVNEKQERCPYCRGERRLPLPTENR